MHVKRERVETSRRSRKRRKLLAGRLFLMEHVLFREIMAILRSVQLVGIQTNRSFLCMYTNSNGNMKRRTDDKRESFFVKQGKVKQNLEEHYS